MTMPTNEDASAETLEADLAMALAHEAASGDLAATNQLLRLVSPAVTRAVRLVLGPKHADVDDVVQQSFIALVQGLPTFRGECHPAGYASRIAALTALGHRRRARLLTAKLRVLAMTGASDSAGRADDRDTAAQRRRLVRELLDRLPPDQAETVALHIVVGQSLEEVAAMTGCPVNTVKSRLRLAKTALRRYLDQDDALVEREEIAS
jgi:RNA polymerase sigma factor (sigma-70 family)